MHSRLYRIVRARVVFSSHRSHSFAYIYELFNPALEHILVHIVYTYFYRKINSKPFARIFHTHTNYLENQENVLIPDAMYAYTPPRPTTTYITPLRKLCKNPSQVHNNRTASTHIHILARLLHKLYGSLIIAPMNFSFSHIY